MPPGLTDVVWVAAGGSHSVALGAGGAVVAWGDNTFGQTNIPASLTNAISVAAGFNTSFALTSDGRVVPWGDDGSGQTNAPSGLTNAFAVVGGGDRALALFSGSIPSPARLVSIRRQPDCTVDLRALAEQGRVYQIQSSSNLTTWPTRATLTNRFGGMFYHDLAPTNSPQQFYRTSTP